jgi:SAM-dependent methyltransferase
MRAVILALRDRAPDLVIAGCDVDKRAIRWCERHLAHGRWVVNDPLPPSPFDGGAFDLIWCGSVFTHLDERRQDLWLRELRRILKPDGVLLATMHGRASWEPRLRAKDAARLTREGILFARLGDDAGIHPDWYQVAWHTEEYVRRHWASILEIRGYLVGGHGDYQDIVIARKAG